MTGTVTSSGPVVLVVAVFLASSVEMVEALTIVLAVGVTRGWRSALEGVVAALVTLAALVALLGPALVHFVPLSALRLVVGGLLLIFGLQWLRKAVLRAAGLKAKHDEDAIFAEQVAELTAAPPSEGRDATGFVVAFKGVFLAGLEVVVIVLTLGTTSHHLGLAAAAGGAARPSGRAHGHECRRCRRSRPWLRGKPRAGRGLWWPGGSWASATSGGTS